MESTEAKRRREISVTISRDGPGDSIIMLVGKTKYVVHQTLAAAIRDVADKLESESDVRWWSITFLAYTGLFNREVAEVIVGIAHDIFRKALLYEIVVNDARDIDGVEVFRSLFESPNSLISLHIPPGFLARMMPSCAITQSLHLHIWEGDRESSLNIASFVRAARIQKLTVYGCPVSIPVVQMDDLAELTVSCQSPTDDPCVLFPFMLACPRLVDLKVKAIFLKGREHVLPRLLTGLSSLSLKNLHISNFGRAESGPWVRDATFALCKLVTLRELKLDLRSFERVHMTLVAQSLPFLDESNTPFMRDFDQKIKDRKGYMMRVVVATWGLGDLQRELAQYIE
jgi:hypothetical protein